jgi:hypothetical protein
MQPFVLHSFLLSHPLLPKIPCITSYATLFQGIFNTCPRLLSTIPIHQNDHKFPLHFTTQR